jgi:hypothetical protein
VFGVGQVITMASFAMGPGCPWPIPGSAELNVQFVKGTLPDGIRNMNYIGDRMYDRTFWM